MKLLQRMRGGARELQSTRERRKAVRRAIPSRLVHVGHGRQVEPARCHDVSEAGARLSMETPLGVGETVIVSFTPDVSLTGKVAWVNDYECGIAFDELVEAAPSSAVPATSSRQSRFRDGLNVKVVLPDGERKAVLRWTKENYASFLIQD